MVVRERVNARRAVAARRCPSRARIATVDVSFISVTQDPARRCARCWPPGADAVVLVKPQFEVGRGQVGRGGIVKDPALHLQALRDVAAAAAAELGYAVRGACASPIAGAEGNREFFLHLRPGRRRVLRGGRAGATLLGAAVRAMSTIGILGAARPRRGGPAAARARGLAAARAASRACLEERTAALVDGAGRAACTRAPPAARWPARADALVVLGGDGTLLAASHLARHGRCPCWA